MEHKDEATTALEQRLAHIRIIGDYISAATVSQELKALKEASKPDTVNRCENGLY